MLVSRKYLTLIHLVASKVAAGLNIAQASHKSIVRGATASPGRILLQPLPKRSIQSLAFRLGYKASLFDQGFIRTERDVLHTDKVYTISVYTASYSWRPERAMLD
jgi:hypothetical protein